MAKGLVASKISVHERVPVRDYELIHLGFEATPYIYYIELSKRLKHTPEACNPRRIEAA